MRKEGVWKQALALVLSAAMVFGNVSPVSAAAGDTAGSAGAATGGTAGDTQKVTDDNAYKAVTFDFEDGVRQVTGDNAIYTENGITFTGAKSIEVVDAPVISGDDAQRGKVLKFSAKRDATIRINDVDVPTVTGTTSLTTEKEALSKYDFSNGVTFSMDICPDQAQADWSYLFGLGTFSDSGHYVTGTIGFIAAFGAPWVHFLPHQSWQTGNSVNSSYVYFYENINQWHHLDYVYTEDGLTIKVDGIPAVAYNPEKETMKGILKELNKGQLRLGQGPEPKNEGFLGYVDNVTITPVAPHQHTYTEVVETIQEATCTRPEIKRVKCSVCGGIVEIETAPANGHTYTNVPAKAATCIEAGNKEHYRCSACHGYFVSGDNGVETITSRDVTIQATGHDYNEVVSKKATAAADGEITKTCKNCTEGTTGHVVKEAIAKASNIALVGASSYTYTGKKITPQVTVKDSAGKDIGTANYTVTYGENTKAGTGTVTVTFKGDKYTGSVTKNFTITAAASLKLNKTKVTLYTGKASKTITIKPTVTGASKTVAWTTSNKKVATVKNGKITAVGKGTATITAKANGITQTVKVTVKNPTITIKNGKKAVKKNTVTVKKKKSVKLTVSVSPKNSGSAVKALSKKDKKIATVSYKKGKLTIKGKKKGTVKVKITSGKTTKTLTVKVK